MAKDFAAFDKAYTSVMNSCNQCPADVGIDYKVPSKAEDVPK